MNAKQKAKLERYLRNASRFLWGLGRGNQKETYDWLEEEGRKKRFEFERGTYRYVTDQLLRKPGIERILNDLIIPRVKERFTDKALEYLRSCWQMGTIPDMSFLKLYNISEKNVYPFLEINLQYNYVERWGEFAGVWFEEIEPLQEPSSQNGE